MIWLSTAGCAHQRERVTITGTIDDDAAPAPARRLVPDPPPQQQLLEAGRCSQLPGATDVSTDSTGRVGPTPAEETASTKTPQADSVTPKGPTPTGSRPR